MIENQLKKEMKTQKELKITNISLLPKIQDNDVTPCPDPVSILKHACPFSSSQKGIANPASQKSILAKFGRSITSFPWL
jgi:hypothetical protein